jgi:hypothetical protein
MLPHGSLSPDQEATMPLPSIHPTSRQASWVAAVIGVGLLLTVAGCGSSGGSGQGGLADAGSSASASPTTSATPTDASTASATATTSTTHTYPSDYAGAILKAWVDHDSTYLKLLTSSATTSQLFGLGHPDQHWTSIDNEGAMGSSYATYTNKTGDAIVIRMNNESLSQKAWHAGSVQTWDPMKFSNDATAYAKSFMDAWINKNKTRMVRLSSQAFANHFTSMTTPDASYTIGEAPGGNAAGHTYLEIKDATSSLDVVIVVATPVLGGPGAIEDCNPSCT